MKKQALRIGLALCMLVGLMTVPANAAADHTTAIAADTATLAAGGSYYLEESIVSTVETITVEAGDPVTLCLNGHTLTKGTDAAAPFIIVSENATLTICDCGEGGAIVGTITDETTEFVGLGFGVYVAADSVYDPEFDPETAEEGAVNGDEDEIAGKLILESGAIKNFAGGGVIVQSGAQFDMTGGEISGNVRVEGYGSAVFVAADSTFNMSGGVITENVVNSSNASHGGAVIVYGTINLSGDAEITANKVTGGAAYSPGVLVSNGTMNMTGGKITNHVGVKYGGGMATLGTGVVVNISGGEISGNSTTDASAVSVGGAGIFVNGTDPVVNISGTAKITDNTSATSGGGIFTYSTATINVSGGEISNNVAKKAGATYGGGGICLYAANSKAVLSGNGKISGNSGYWGGGIMTFNTGVTITIKDSAEISDNTAAYAGGGIFLTNAGNKVNMTGGKIFSNDCTRAVPAGTSSQIFKQGGGGGIATSYLASRTPAIEINISGGEVSENTSAGIGGGIVAALNCKVNLSGTGKISKNVSVHHGAGIMLESNSGSVNPTLTMTGGEISGNKATSASSYGAGVVAFSCSRANISGGVIKDNEGFNYGGGIGTHGTSAAAQPIINITGGEISGNFLSGTAPQGAAIFMNNAKVNISGNTVVKNNYCVDPGEEVTTQAGAISVYHASAVCTINGGTFLNNQAEGGAFFTRVAGATLNVNGGYIDGKINQGTGNVGTVALSGGYYTVKPDAETMLAEGKAVYGLMDAKVVDGKAYGYTVDADTYAPGDLSTALASVELNESLAMNLYLPQDAFDGDYVAYAYKCNAEGNDPAELPAPIAIADWELGEGDYEAYYRLPCTDIAAKEMGDTVKFMIVEPTKGYIVYTKDSSVKAYAEALVATEDETNVQIAVDLLTYGAAAQNYFMYNTENLVNADLSFELQDMATANTLNKDAFDAAPTYTEDVLKYFYGSSLLLEDKIDLQFYLISAATNGKTVKIQVGEEAEVEVTPDAIQPSMSRVSAEIALGAAWDTDVTVTIYDGETALASVTESIGDWVQRTEEWTGAETLGLALMAMAKTIASV